ncbi:unnamed protein product, partial [Rotaria sp. Silwood2]
SATSDNDLVAGFTAFQTSVSSVRQQIVMYKKVSNLNKINFARTLYVIWADINDYCFNTTLLPTMVVKRLVNGINNLISIGGKQFLILNELRLPSYPSDFAIDINDYSKSLIHMHNSNLSKSIQSLRSNFSYVSLKLFDIDSFITNILMNTSAYGINSTKIY